MIWIHWLYAYELHSIQIFICNPPLQRLPIAVLNQEIYSKNNKREKKSKEIRCNLVKQLSCRLLSIEPPIYNNEVYENMYTFLSLIDSNIFKCKSLNKVNLQVLCSSTLQTQFFFRCFVLCYCALKPKKISIFVGCRRWCIMSFISVEIFCILIIESEICFGKKRKIKMEFTILHSI